MEVPLWGCDWSDCRYSRCMGAAVQPVLAWKSGRETVMMMMMLYYIYNIYIYIYIYITNSFSSFLASPLSYRPSLSWDALAHSAGRLLVRAPIGGYAITFGVI